MDYIFYQVAAINGFDSVGHYLRAALIVNTCSQYALTHVARLHGELPGPRRGRRGRDAGDGERCANAASPGRAPDVRRAKPGKPAGPTTASSPATAADAVCGRRRPADGATGPLLDYLMGG